MNEVTPYLRNRRTGIVVRYNPITATHPDMVLCDELPWEKEAAAPAKRTRTRKEKTEPKVEAEPKVETKPAPEAETPPTAEIDDLLSGIEHG